MPPIVQKARENPIATLISLISTLGAIIGAFLLVDERYAHAAELEKLRGEQRQLIIQHRYDLRQSTLMMRRQSLEDKVFELSIIPNSDRSNVDNARLERYQRELNETYELMRQPPPPEVIR